jgi:hypothetical protein
MILYDMAKELRCGLLLTENPRVSESKARGDDESRIERTIDTLPNNHIFYLLLSLVMF